MCLWVHCIDALLRSFFIYFIFLLPNRLSCNLVRANIRHFCFPKIYHRRNFTQKPFLLNDFILKAQNMEAFFLQNFIFFFFKCKKQSQMIVVPMDHFDPVTKCPKDTFQKENIDFIAENAIK